MEEQQRQQQEGEEGRSMAAAAVEAESSSVNNNNNNNNISAANNNSSSAANNSNNGSSSGGGILAAAADDDDDGRRAVVCGGGAIGVCTAYYLAKKGLRVTLVERVAVAAAASGKAGGFLALDWCDGSPLGKLARASFLLHQRLADELDGAARYGYRRIDTLSVFVDESSSPSPPSSSSSSSAAASPATAACSRADHQQQQQLPHWVDGPVRSVSSIGSQATTAQVHPALFTRTVLAAAVDRFGVRVVNGTVQELKLDPYRRKLIGVVVDRSLLLADVAVVAMGPWSGSVQPVSQLTRITGRKAHSIVLRPKSTAPPPTPPAGSTDGSTADPITAHALLLRYKTKEGKQLAPEVYPRPGGEVYVSGMSEECPLPDVADDVLPRLEAALMLKRVGETVSSCLRGAEVEAEQACFMPLSEDGRPLIGKLPDMEGAYVATGHGYWGILNAPATGAFLAELIADGSCKTLDLKYFDPARFAKLRKCPGYI